MLSIRTQLQVSSPSLTDVPSVFAMSHSRVIGLLLLATVVAIRFWWTRPEYCSPDRGAALHNLLYDTTPLVARHRFRVEQHCDVQFMNEYMASRTRTRSRIITGLAIVIPDELGGWGNIVLFNHMWRLFVAFLWDDLRSLTKHHRYDPPGFAFGTGTLNQTHTASFQWEDYWHPPTGLTLTRFPDSFSVNHLAWQWRDVPSVGMPLSSIVTEPPSTVFVPIRPNSTSPLLDGMRELRGKHTNLDRVSRTGSRDVPGCLSHYLVQDPKPELRSLVAEMYGRLPPSIRVIGIHDRAGDARMCTTHLKTFERADKVAAELQNLTGTEPVFFVAADTREALADARERWPGRVLTVPGDPKQPEHLALNNATRQQSKEFTRKAVADWFLLTLCDAVVTGASSTFSSTAVATGFNAVKI